MSEQSSGNTPSAKGNAVESMTHLDSFVKVLADVIPVLDKIKQTIEESTGTMPKASNQLTNVTKATEMATVEILNVLDAMGTKLNKADEGISQLRALCTQGNGIPGSVTILDGIAQNLAETRGDAMNIAMALQVQDITSQQIAGVTHLIESVRVQLTTVLADGSKPATRDTAHPSHFDSDAQYVTSPERQSSADEIIRAWKEEKI